MRKIRIIFLTVAVAAALNVESAAQGNVLVALNKAENTIAIIDADTMKVTGKVAVGDGPHEVVFSSDGKLAFVANYGAQAPGSSLSVIDIPNKKELRRVDLSPLMRPHGLVMIGGKLYFTAEVNRVIARYDPAANKVDWLMGTGQNGSHMIVISSDQRRMYTSNIGSDSISAFDFMGIPPAGSRLTHIPVGKQPEAIDLSPDGKEVWVGLNVDGGVDIIDTTALKVIQRVNVGGRPYRVKFSPDGKKVLFNMLAGKEVILFDAAGRRELKRLKLESTPMGVVFTPDGRTAYVSVVQPDAILKLDLDKMSIAARTESGSAPDGIAYFGK
jgi:YVTN family beta-propeller protein